MLDAARRGHESIARQLGERLGQPERAPDEPPVPPAPPTPPPSGDEPPVSGGRSVLGILGGLLTSTPRDVADRLRGEPPS
jgi:hypothetical protein